MSQPPPSVPPPDEPAASSVAKASDSEQPATTKMPLWGKITIPVLVVLLLVLAGSSGSNLDEAEQLRAEVARLEQDLADAQAEAESTTEAAAVASADAEAEIEQLQAALKDAEDAVAAAEVDADEVRAEALDEVQDELEAVREEIAAAEAELTSVRGDIDQARTEVHMSEMPTGTYIVGEDVLAGRWRAPGGPGCYWAIEDSRGNIQRNHFGDGAQVVNLSDGQYFVNEDCGGWTRDR